MHDIVPVMRSFDEESKKVDLSVASAFIQGDCQTKPILFYIDLISDLYTTFRDANSKLRCYAKVLTDSDIDSLEIYQKAFNPKETKLYFEDKLSLMSLLEREE